MLSIKLFRLVFCLFWFNKKSVLVYKQNKGNKLFRNNQNIPIFQKKIPYMLSIKLFQLVLCLFRFNRNTETLCFVILQKRNNRNKHFVLVSAKTSFGCFESKLVSKETLVRITIITYGAGFDRTREVEMAAIFTSCPVK